MKKLLLPKKKHLLKVQKALTLKLMVMWIRLLNLSLAILVCNFFYKIKEIKVL